MQHAAYESYIMHHVSYNLKNDDDLKNEDNLKSEDDLDNKDNLKKEDDLKTEDDIKNEDNLKIGLRSSLFSEYIFMVVFMI